MIAPPEVRAVPIFANLGDGDARCREAGGATEMHASRDPYLLETSVPGIFACGDVRSRSVKRVAAGVGEGSMSIAFVHQFLATAT